MFTLRGDHLFWIIYNQLWYYVHGAQNGRYVSTYRLYGEAWTQNGVMSKTSG
ncbi:hypothetical protein [Mechercharimyces sp. CAU 1602]|uniref:hypothetical protein n=1 Tax=Mechercharimyces sp. CAU 1602 TaxID=2973933 RepID=UPI00216372F3|nr:hypothetical protein [Mechercharimyces sp. CAU 1602]